MINLKKASEISNAESEPGAMELQSLKIETLRNLADEGKLKEAASLCETYLKLDRGVLMPVLYALKFIRSKD